MVGSYSSSSASFGRSLSVRPASTASAVRFFSVEVVQKTPPRQRQRLNVAWYGGGRRDVEVGTGTASWYEADASLVPVRGWTEKTVLRVTPFLFGRYTVVAVLYAQMPVGVWKQGLILWPGKQEATFSDAITRVRRWLGLQWVFAIPGHNTAFSKPGQPFREMLLAGLAPAA